MLLRVRITILVSLVFVATFGGLILAGLQRERLAELPQSRIAIGGIDALWREVVDRTAVPLVDWSTGVASDSGLLDALATGSPALIRPVAVTYATRRIASGALTDFQILTTDGGVLFAASAAAEPGRLLDVGTLETVAAGRNLVGLRQVDQDNFRIIVARPLDLGGAESVVLAMATPVDSALSAVRDALGAQVYLLNTRGRVIDRLAEDPWAAFDLTLAQRTATVAQASLDDRLYAVTSVPLADISAGSAGLLVTVRDATESLAAVQRLTWLTLGGTVAVLLIVLVGLLLYLRAGFRPLDQAVAALGALARGDTAVRLDGQGNDEIGKIADAVRGLRQHLVALDDARRQRELQRRRQERFVRRQMETLAGALESGAREEVLNDLRRIVAAGARREAPIEAPKEATTEAPAETQTPTDAVEPTDPTSTDPAPGSPGATDAALARLIREDDQLGPLAAVLQQMSGRVVDQHRRLTEVINRLQEALVRETELASLQQELRIASDLQRSILPKDFPDRPEFLLHGVMEPAKEVGGDFYDFFDRGDGRIAVVIADVSGKGVPAAFFMAICRTLLKAIALFEDDPATCIRQLNDLLSAGNEQMMFVTLFFGLYDPATGRLGYVNAGHNPPFLVGREGSPRMLERSADIAVAVIEDMAFTNQELTLEPGDRLVLYTDGMTEAFSPDGSEFGDDRLSSALDETRSVPGQEVNQRLVDIVHRFEDGGEQSDDMTLLVLDRKVA